MFPRFALTVAFGARMARVLSVSHGNGAFVKYVSQATSAYRNVAALRSRRSGLLCDGRETATQHAVPGPEGKTHPSEEDALLK